jgi:hypothetical protein
MDSFIIPRFHHSRGSRAMSVPKRQVYLRCNGKALRTTVDEVVEFFAGCGKPTSVLNKYGEEPEGGVLHERVLVTFKKDKAAEKAVALSGQQLSSREIVIGINILPPRPKGGATGSVRAFVGNLPFDAPELTIREHFAACGTIQFIRFAADADGNPRGFCHVIFADPPNLRGEALAAALALDGTTLLGRTISVGPSESKKPPKKKAPKRAAPDGSEPEVKKVLRPAEWRHDRAAGLTMPRKSWKRPSASHDDANGPAPS